MFLLPPIHNQPWCRNSYYKSDILLAGKYNYFITKLMHEPLFQKRGNVTLGNDSMIVSQSSSTPTVNPRFSIPLE